MQKLRCDFRWFTWLCTECKHTFLSEELQFVQMHCPQCNSLRVEKAIPMEVRK